MSDDLERPCLVLLSASLRIMHHVFLCLIMVAYCINERVALLGSVSVE